MQSEHAEHLNIYNVCTRMQTPIDPYHSYYMWEVASPYAISIISIIVLIVVITIIVVIFANDPTANDPTDATETFGHVFGSNSAKRDTPEISA